MKITRNLFSHSLLLSIVGILMGSGFQGNATEPITTHDVDVCVYGGTASGVMAAYSAKKMGKTVILIEPGKHLGGMTTSGLGFTDVGQKESISGLARLFYRKIGNHYNKFEEWYFPPSVASSVIDEFIAEGEIDVKYQRRIIAATIDQGKINSIVLEDSQEPQSPQLQISAKIFVDCSYEGDLMAKAGVSYTIGRESNSTYGESRNGIQLAYYHQFPDGVDPYKIEGDPTSGLCWGVSDEALGTTGEGDNSIQAYNYRLCMTKDENNKVPFSRPESYNREVYELLARAIQKMSPEKQLDINSYFAADAIPGNKYDINNRGAFSTNMIGMNHRYPEGSYEERAQICKDQEEYIRGLFYFLTTDEAVPQALRDKVNEFGWAKDEFIDNNYFPYQIYIREARRMVGEYIMTQKNCEGTEVVTDGIGMASYAMDSHNCRRIIHNGMVKNEGDVEIALPAPFPISYRSITPKREECSNLLVPVCVSSSHIAYGSIRMEPVFMQLGQAAGIAAAMAIDDNSPVQNIDVQALQQKLNNDPYLDGSGPETIVGSGTETDPYLIGNVYQLSQVSNHLDAHFKLTSDIDLSGISLSPIGSILKPFKGVFDGNGYAITNATMTVQGQFAGFFGAIVGGTVKNLWLKQMTITQTATGAGDDVALLAGYGESATIQNCAVQGTVIGGTHNNIGGIMGRSGGSATVTISNCYVEASVSGNKTIGGIVGAATAPTLIECCLVKGEIFSPNRAGAATALTNNAGSSFSGIVATDLVITDSGSTGNGTAMNRIIGDGTSGAYNNNLASTTVVFNGIDNKSIQSGLDTKDGLTQTPEELKMKDTYVNIGYKFGSDIGQPWFLSEDGQSYPVLWYMNPEWEHPTEPKPAEAAEYAIIPMPLSLVPSEGTFELSSQVTVFVPGGNTDLYKVVEDFTNQIETTSGIYMPVTIGNATSSENSIQFSLDPSVAPEGYNLQVTPSSIMIESSTAQGAFYAIQTLYQLLPPAVCGSTLIEGLELKIRCVDIQDEPRFAYRGMHLDVARFFKSVDFIKRYIDILALHKINHFHWHLTDDQGWRIEIKQYPRLVEIGSTREQSAIGFTGKYDGIAHSGYYTQEQIKEVVAYAAERFITVVPEIEMPGHATAALAAYPELSCFPEQPHEVQENFGIFTDLMCPKESTFTFLENVLTELLELFPSPYYHIGGDECSPLTSSWSKCQHCQELIKNLGLADETALQNYFMNRIATFMNTKGKQIIGWNEILKGGSGLPENAIVMSWTGGAAEAASQGHKVIMTPWEYVYLDYYQLGEDIEKIDHLSCGGFIPLQKVYGYDPVPAGLSNDDARYIYGVQGNCWSETLDTEEKVMYQVFPRGLAIAELGWTPKARKDFDSFRERVAEDYPRLEAKGFTPGEAFYRPVFIFDRDNTYPKRLEITLGYPKADIHYTLDGTEPTVESPIYTGPLTLPEGTVIKAAGFEGEIQVGETCGIWFGNNTFFLPGRFEKGDGTPENPYEITNAYQLDEMHNGLSASYRLANDIDLKYYPFSPIGNINTGQHFSGSLDGNGYSITNAEINGGGWVGFFGTCKDCTIKNLYLKDISVTASSDYAGGLAGYLIGGTITNCAVTGKVVANGNASTNYGGLVGLTSGDATSTKVQISNCYVDVYLEPSLGGAAGLVGVTAMPTEINHCIVNGHLLSSNRAAAAVAISKSAGVSISGVVAANLEIERLGSSGTVNWFNRIIAENRSPLASLSNNLADNDQVFFTNVADKIIDSGHSSSDGLSMTTRQLSQQSTYTEIGFQFGNDEQSPWFIEEGKYHPSLWFMNDIYTDINHFGSNPSLTVYPIPCTDVLHIEGRPILSCDLYSLSGSKIGRYTSSAIDLSDLQPGIYFLEINTTQKAEVFRIIKK